MQEGTPEKTEQKASKFRFAGTVKSKMATFSGDFELGISPDQEYTSTYRRCGRDDKFVVLQPVDEKGEGKVYQKNGDVIVSLTNGKTQSFIDWTVGKRYELILSAKGETDYQIKLDDGTYHLESVTEY